MIRRIQIKNFGSLLDVDVELGPLTVLVGPNAAGKSMFLRALRALAKLLRSPVRGPEGEFSIDYATLDDLAGGERISFRVWVEETAEPTYCLELGKVTRLWTVTKESLRFEGLNFDSGAAPFEFGTQHRGKIPWDSPGNPPRHATLPYLVFPYQHDAMALQDIQPFLNFREALGWVYGYRVSPTDLVSPLRPDWIPRKNPYVDFTGNGFVHTLRAWYQTAEGDGVFRTKVLPELHRLFPHIQGIGFQDKAPRVFLEYSTDRGSKAVPAGLESDGVNLTLFLLCIPFLAGRSPGTSCGLCLEEPESGTHPYLHSQRLDLLRRIASGEVTGEPIQVIATTHSPEFLRWVRPEEALGVLRFVGHLGPEGGTKIHRVLSQEDMDRVLEQYERDAGLAWCSGVFGAVPAKTWSEPDE